MEGTERVDWSAEGQREQAAKFVQVCASQNDLFALDEEGEVYQYNFGVKTWVRLAAGRRPQDTAVGEAGGRPAQRGGIRGARPDTPGPA